jgi:carboxypeptidase family protein
MFATKIRRGLGRLSPPGSTIRFRGSHYKGHREVSKGRAFLGVLLSLLLLSGSTPAQSSTSSVGGTVVDPQGKAVAGATVTLTSGDTNSVRTATVGENGSFLFNLVQPGQYQLEASAAGFKKAVIKDVRALVARPTDVTVELEVGGVSDTVTVSAGTSDVLVNKQDASLGINFQAQQITQLPLESRNVVALLSLQPGVTKEGYVAGSRADQANVTLDGVDVNEQQGAEAFESVLRVTPDSVQEFRVTTTNANASQGRSAGAQVSLVTKGGTNEWHGSLYEYHRNTIFTANDFFNNRAGRFVAGDPEVVKGLKNVGEERLPRPKLIRNLFGGSVGGPIVKDRAFFFYNYEGRRDASEVAVGPRIVPLASLGRGEVRFIGAAGGQSSINAAQINAFFPAVGVNPAAIAVLASAAARYPANDDSAGDGLNTAGFRFNASTPAKFSTHIARFDWNVTEAADHLLFARLNYQQDVVGGIPRFPDTLKPTFWNHPTGFVVGHTWSLRKSLVNDFRYGMTRTAFSNQGDSSANAISFRDVFQPVNFSRSLNRITPVHNFTDDVSWVKGTHSIQFGTNIRIIRNGRVSFGNSFDSAVANRSFYDQSGAVLTPAPVRALISSGSVTSVRTALTAVIGRFSQYEANFNFNGDGTILGVGEGVGRDFATEEYDFYFQDSWKLRSNLTFTAGLRYGLSRPVYESNGLQVKPTTSLGDFFERRKASSAKGTPLNELITVDLAGPANGKPGFYDWDKNNFQPRVALAWSPSFEHGFLRKMFGSPGDSVIRGGFAITNDHFGQQLAVQFDLNNTLGFSSSSQISANTFNVTTRPAPLFTGFGQQLRTLPNITVPAALKFPLNQPADEQQRIESSLDDSLITPVNYSWNVSVGRKLPGGFFVEASYIGRKARNLLATRDIMALNNLVDPKSGMDWYTAAGMLHDLRDANTQIDNIKAIPYFENLFPGLGDSLLGEPGLSATQAVYVIVAREFVDNDITKAPIGGFNILDWTFVQTFIDDLGIVPNLFFHPQYAALSTFSTVAKSDYHAGTLSIRQRYRDQIFFDFNYTLSKSIDDASGLQTSGAFGAAFILNPLRPQDSRGLSDFDVKHIINANAGYQLPFGRGKKYLSGMPGFAEAIFGGWQITGIYRWNSGPPVSVPFESQRWATNWNISSNTFRGSPLESSPTKSGKVPNLFADPESAYRNFRQARPGETGERNTLRLPGFVVMDMGLDKSFTMPYNENHKLQLRWEVFNVTNTQRLGGLDNFFVDLDPHLANSTPVDNFANFTAIQGTPRVMQIGLRYTF